MFETISHQLHKFPEPFTSMKTFVLKPAIIDPQNSILDYFNQIY